MGIWSGIKYALNNTLGTSSFKPLNKIITDAETAIKSLVTTETTGVETHVTSQATSVKTAITTSETNIKNHVTSAIKDNVSLVASDEKYYQFSQALQTWYGNGTTAETTLVTLTMPCSGSANLQYRVGSSYSGTTVSMYIYINGALYKKITEDNFSNSVVSKELLSFSKGDTISIRVSHSSSGRIYAYLQSINATPLCVSTPTNITAIV